MNFLAHLLCVNVFNQLTFMKVLFRIQIDNSFIWKLIQMEQRFVNFINEIGTQNRKNLLRTKTFYSTTNYLNFQIL